MDCLVRVSQGALRGKECWTPNGTKYLSFEGIPYAKPPIGKLRFQPPQPPVDWEGILDATKPGPKCAQINPFKPDKTEGSEDCLFLNIYRPDSKSLNLPVLFFVHGGRYLQGHGDYYRPDYFMEQNVILITINYRLNILGFLCLHTPEVPGNAGLKDSVAALKWVKGNVKEFGGDPENITVFGESSGSATVSSYLVTDLAKGLFSKVISESGICTALLFMNDDDPVAKARKAVEFLGKKAGDVNEIFDILQKASLNELLELVFTCEWSKEILSPYFSPVVERNVDGAYFKEFPYVSIKNGRFADVPIMMGTNSFEGAYFMYKNEDGSYDQDIQVLVPYYLKYPKNSKKSLDFANKLHKYYIGDREISDATLPEYLNLLSDAYFQKDIYFFAEMVSRRNKLFFYSFDYSGAMNTSVMQKLGVKGATHSDILAYQFYRRNKHEVGTSRDKDVVKFFSEAWTSFAASGEPKWTNQKTKWLPFEGTKKLILDINNESKELVKCPYSDRMQFWASIIGRTSKL